MWTTIYLICFTTWPDSVVFNNFKLSFLGQVISNTMEVFLCAAAPLDIALHYFLLDAI
jgi:hypothetical protein